jgi:hypothetical protein
MYTIKEYTENLLQIKNHFQNISIVNECIEKQVEFLQDDQLQFWHFYICFSETWLSPLFYFKALDTSGSLISLKRQNLILTQEIVNGSVYYVLHPCNIQQMYQYVPSDLKLVFMINTSLNLLQLPCDW